MTLREKLERDIATVEESLRMAFATMGTPGLSPEEWQRERDSIAPLQADLAALKNRLSELPSDERDR